MEIRNGGNLDIALRRQWLSYLSSSRALYDVDVRQFDLQAFRLSAISSDEVW